MTSETTYTHLKDGTPVRGVYDTDGTPILVSIEWQEMYISTDGEESISLPDGDLTSGEYTLSHYGKLRELITSGVIEELIVIARRFLKSEPGPVLPPVGTEDDAAFLDWWHTLDRAAQLRCRPIFSKVLTYLDRATDEQIADFLTEVEQYRRAA